MKEFIEFIKTLFSNKKTRSLAILILYFIFFILVFAFINSGSKPVPVIPKDPLEELKTKEIDKIEIIGINNFTIENGKVYYNDTIYELNELPEELLIYDLSIFKPINFYNLFKIAILESKNYVEKSNTYLLNSEQFEKVIYGMQTDNKYNVRITNYDDMYDQILLDLQEAYGYKAKIDLRS